MQVQLLSVTGDRYAGAVVVSDRRLTTGMQVQLSLVTGDDRYAGAVVVSDRRLTTDMQVQLLSVTA